MNSCGMSSVARPLVMLSHTSLKTLLTNTLCRMQTNTCNQLLSYARAIDPLRPSHGIIPPNSTVSLTRAGSLVLTGLSILLPEVYPSTCTHCTPHVCLMIAPMEAVQKRSHVREQGCIVARCSPLHPPRSFNW